MKFTLFLKGLPVMAALIATTSLTACDALLGKEVARLPLNAVSTPEREVVKEATLTLQKDDVITFWSEMDMAYHGQAPLRFQVQVLQNAKPFQQLEFDPTEKNVSLKEVRTDVNGSINWSFTGKNATLTIPQTASYTFKARLVAANNPTLNLRKAHLVLKK